MSDIIDRLVDFLKWPVAFFVLATLPASISFFSYFNFFTLKNAIFLGGFLFFLGFSATLDREVRATMQTLAHELTHAFFAIITLHKVTSVRVYDQGGVMSFKGRGNWLILVAPYFFPLFLFLLIVALSVYNIYFENNILSKSYYPLLISFVFGVLTGAHFDMIGSQVHENQTDLKKLGLPFSLMFIIPANALTMGLLAAFNASGFLGVKKYFVFIIETSEKYIEMYF